MSTNLPQTPLTRLLGIRLPIIQAGMVYCSGAKLAAAAANAGCLGVVGAGSMAPEVLDAQLHKLKGLTSAPVAVNLPLLYKRIDEQIDTALRHGIRIFITSAGSPSRYTTQLKSMGCLVVHVASHPKLALKCQDAGVDAVIIEGFEAGGHNGREELTTLVLLQQCRGLLSIPLVAAGGIASGAAIAAALMLGADGVQIGTLFAAAAESSAHKNFKDALVAADWSDTALQMKKLVPVRLLRNPFAEGVRQLEERGAAADELAAYLGKGRARAGMLEGDMDNGELEIGQAVSQVHSVRTTAEIVDALCDDYSRSVGLFMNRSPSL
jgi:enoyl-[acyl-carrier protein] reductase II